MFTNLLDQELERRGYRTIHQKADACDVTYEAMRQILKDGKHLSDEKVVEIGRKLGLSDEKMAEMIMAKVYDKTKAPERYPTDTKKQLQNNVLKNSTGRVIPQSYTTFDRPQSPHFPQGQIKPPHSQRIIPAAVAALCRLCM